VVERLPSMLKALGSLPVTQTKQNKTCASVCVCVLLQAQAGGSLVWRLKAVAPLTAAQATLPLVFQLLSLLWRQSRTRLGFLDDFLSGAAYPAQL
jgi:hypothetical protein